MMKLLVLLILVVFASEQKENDAENGPENAERFDNPILVKIEEEEYVKVNKKSKFIGVTYDKDKSKWRAQRWSKNENTMISNGRYEDEETAAHASDTLARILKKSAKQKLKLNFPDDHTEIYPKKSEGFTSKYIGVTYNKNSSKWYAERWSKTENKSLFNGCYDDEETAAHASDTLARKFMRYDDHKLKLNFPDDYTKVYPEKTFTSKYFGVTYCKNESKWRVQRWSKTENTMVSNGRYEDEETAAHASDTLARILKKSAKQKLKLNFPDDRTEVYPEDSQSKYIGVAYHKKNSKWRAQRWSKHENTMVSNGCYKDEETAAHASDTLARNLMKNGKQKLKLNFPNDHTEVFHENRKKRKRPKDFSLEHPQNN